MFSVSKAQSCVIDILQPRDAAALTENWTDTFIACFHKWMFVIIDWGYLLAFTCLRLKKLNCCDIEGTSFPTLNVFKFQWSICHIALANNLSKQEGGWTDKMTTETNNMKLIVCFCTTFWHTALVLICNLISLKALLFMTSCQGLVDSEATLCYPSRKKNLFWSVQLMSSSSDEILARVASMLIMLAGTLATIRTLQSSLFAATSSVSCFHGFSVELGTAASNTFIEKKNI